MTEVFSVFSRERSSTPQENEGDRTASDYADAELK
jgi:hypothetical protein